MPKKKQWRILRIAIWWSIVSGALLGLAAGIGSLTRDGVIALSVCLGIGVALATVEHGWHRAPLPIGTPLRSVLLLMLITVMCFGIAIIESPKPHPSPVPVRRANVQIESIEFLKVVPHKQMGINIFFKNAGDGGVKSNEVYALVSRTATDAKVGSADDHKALEETEDYLWNAFQGSQRSPQKIERVIPPHSMTMWTTIFGESLDEWQTKKLQNGGFTIWFMGNIVYGDNVGEQTMQFCFFYRGDPKVVFTCRKHNGPDSP